jgi:hypothetical protein
MDHENTTLQYLLPIEAILQSCELQIWLSEGPLEEQCFLARTYVAISGVKVACTRYRTW